MAGIRHVDAVRVMAWGKSVGAAAFDPRRKAVAFEYDPRWLAEGIDLAPLTMPITGPTIHRFPTIEPTAFRGLPGMLADALPDRFGNQLVDQWMARRGVREEEITVLDRLAYMGDRSMGALSFKPDRKSGREGKGSPLEMGELVDAARRALQGTLDGGPASERALQRVISVGTSAGGARAKAVLAISDDRTQILSGQFDAPAGFAHWLLKFDGMGKDEALGPSQQYGRIEYAYHLMARAAGIAMTDCELLHEGDRAHFMTRRFDRDGNDRIHVQSYCAMTHRSFNEAGVHAYEDLFQTILELGLGDDALLEMYRRMAFNVAAANHDDHTKNFAFLLPEAGEWRMAPAFDVTFAYSEKSPWTNQHQMSVNGKFRDIGLRDIRSIADRFSIGGAKDTLESVHDAVARWSSFAAEASVDSQWREDIARHHRKLR